MGGVSKQEIWIRSPCVRLHHIRRCSSTAKFSDPIEERLPAVSSEAAVLCESAPYYEIFVISDCYRSEIFHLPNESSESTASIYYRYGNHFHNITVSSTVGSVDGGDCRDPGKRGKGKDARIYLLLRADFVCRNRHWVTTPLRV